MIPIALTLVVFFLFARDSPTQPAPKPWADYASVLRQRDTWWFCLFYSVTFGGFVGLASFLNIFFFDQYGLTRVQAGKFATLCVIAGSFLGTMVERGAVLQDVGAEFAARIHVVPEFSPNELAGLLSKCAVGAFPSYIEGFGLAVLEQLAAGIPTVAFDQGGPRDILRPSMPELLVPTGDIENFANTIVRILQLDTGGYERLVQLSKQRADQYSWSAIAEKTIEQYRSALAGMPTYT